MPYVVEGTNREIETAMEKKTGVSFWVLRRARRVVQNDRFVSPTKVAQGDAFVLNVFSSTSNNKMTT